MGIISDTTKMAQQRDMEQLDVAMKSGYFSFATQSEIQQKINESDTSIVAEKSLKLCFAADKKIQKMSSEQIQSKIDIILLCRRSSDIAQNDGNENEEEKKKFWMSKLQMTRMKVTM